DPHYALAHSGLTDAYSLLGHYGVLAPAEVWTKTAASATTAVMLDPHSVEGQTSLAHVKASQDWDWTGAERLFRHAISLDPSYATAHHWYAMTCLAPLGRLDEALDEVRIAQSLDPVSAIIARDSALIRCYRREFDLALEQCDHAIELNPHFSAAFWTLALIQQQRHDFEEATAACQRAIHLSPSSPRMHGALGYLYALTGKRKPSLEILEKLREFSSARYVSPMEFACIHFALGDDTGFEWLSRACKDRCIELLWINVDPRFDQPRLDRRYAEVGRQLGLGAARPRPIRAGAARPRRRARL
ncbi:MAG: tetratricopeptide repeat protein, partial [Streptosporangiaceae bacterium]